MCLLSGSSKEFNGTRALFASTTHHFITEACIKTLGLEDEVVDCSILGRKVWIEIHSTNRAFSTTIECGVVPVIDIRSPSENVSFNAISSITGVISLADPDLHLARPIDLILSTDLMQSFIGKYCSLGDGLIQLESVFGELISGKLFV